MEILKYRKDANSPWQDIIAIKGEPGEKGEPGKFADLTEEEKASLKGADGIRGSVIIPIDSNTIIKENTTEVNGVVYPYCAGNTLWLRAKRLGIEYIYAGDIVINYGTDIYYIAYVKDSIYYMNKLVSLVDATVAALPDGEEVSY